VTRIALKMEAARTSETSVDIQMSLIICTLHKILWDQGG